MPDIAENADTLAAAPAKPKRLKKRHHLHFHDQPKPLGKQPTLRLIAALDFLGAAAFPLSSRFAPINNELTFVWTVPAAAILLAAAGLCLLARPRSVLLALIAHLTLAIGALVALIHRGVLFKASAGGAVSPAELGIIIGLLGAFIFCIWWLARRYAHDSRAAALARLEQSRGGDSTMVAPLL